MEVSATDERWPCKESLLASEGFCERGVLEHDEQAKIFEGADPTAARIPSTSRKLVENFISLNIPERFLRAQDWR